MASVARAAGVGIANLFRRFPTREDLIKAVFATLATALAAAPLRGEVSAIMRRG